MINRSIALLTCSMFVLPAAEYSWGNKGHQTVGRIAELFLQDDNAQTTLDKIQAILKPVESLASIATWAETVKRVHFGPDVVVSDKDTQAFRRDLRNKNNRAEPAYRQKPKPFLLVSARYSAYPLGTTIFPRMCFAPSSYALGCV